MTGYGSTTGGYSRQGNNRNRSSSTSTSSTVSSFIPCFRWLGTATQNPEGLSWMSCYKRDKQYNSIREEGSLKGSIQRDIISPTGTLPSSSSFVILPPPKPYDGISSDILNIQEFNTQHLHYDDTLPLLLPDNSAGELSSPAPSGYISGSSEGYLTPIEESITGVILRLQESRMAYNITLAMSLGYTLSTKIDSNIEGKNNNTILLTGNMMVGYGGLKDNHIIGDTTIWDSRNDDLISLGNALYDATIAACNTDPYEDTLLSYSESMSWPVIPIGARRPLCLRIWKRDLHQQGFLIRGEFYVEATPRAFCEFSANSLSSRIIENISDGIDIVYTESSIIEGRGGDIEEDVIKSRISPRNGVLLRIIRPGHATDTHITAACSIDHMEYVNNQPEGMIRSDISMSWLIAHPLYNGDVIMGSRVEFLIQCDNGPRLLPLSTLKYAITHVIPSSILKLVEGLYSTAAAT